MGNYAPLLRSLVAVFRKVTSEEDEIGSVLFSVGCFFHAKKKAGRRKWDAYPLDLMYHNIVRSFRVVDPTCALHKINHHFVRDTDNSITVDLADSQLRDSSIGKDLQSLKHARFVFRIGRNQEIYIDGGSRESSHDNRESSDYHIIGPQLVETPADQNEIVVARSTRL